MYVEPVVVREGERKRISILPERERERERERENKTKHHFSSDPFSVSQNMKPDLFQNAFIFLLALFSLTSTSTISYSSPSDSTALLAFKSKADLANKLKFSPNTTLAHCNWQGVKCLDDRVVRLVLEGLGLDGNFPPDTLTRLTELRVLSLQHNSLSGPIPDLAGLVNLKTLFLDHNSFAGPIPPSISTLHRLRTLDLSFNTLSGSIPPSLNGLDRLYSLRLESNRLTGSVPSLNQTTLVSFNVSGNNLTGAVPVTPVLLRFGTSSFSSNPGLCGEIMNRECRTRVPFFSSSPAAAEAPTPVAALGQNEQAQQVAELTRPSQNKQKKTAAIIGFSSGVFVLVGSAVCFAIAVKKRRRNRKVLTAATMASDSSSAAAAAAAAARIEEDEKDLEEKVRRMQGAKPEMGKSGSLVFCAGESQVYTVEMLMRGSAEVLGRGTMGTTYKAVLDNRLIVTVKRLDAVRLAGTGEEVFERHMESVGGLRHPNLVPLRAYFQANGERLLVYDYFPNGSLFSLIHDSKSARAKPLHWTSCLKIAEDIAQGLSYVHQAWRLVHGNLKSSNILLGPDFEACLTDYSLSVLATSSSPSDPSTIAYKAPETRVSNRETTSKSDIYAYGILLVELLTGKPPPQNPYLSPDDMIRWFRSARDDDGEEDERLGMLLEVAIVCSAASPEQRPTMWQVLKMIQEIKEAVVLEDRELDPLTGMS